MTTRVTAGVIAAAVLAAAGCIVRNPNLESGVRMTEAGRGTAPSMPPFEESDEATAQQLERARDEGRALERELVWFRGARAAASGEMMAGEYVVTYVITPAESYYEGTVRHAPTAGMVHLGAVVRDAADGRFVPGLDVRATITGSNETRTVALPFGWHPVLNRYGENVALPRGPLTLHISIESPTYRRHDPDNGDRFADSAFAEFTGVSVLRDSMESMLRRAGDDDAQGTMLTRDEGSALGRSLDEMFSSVAVNGIQTRSSDYDVVLAVERAETYWRSAHGKLEYEFRPERSAATNAHVEIGVREAVTGRFLPGLSTRATILDSHGRSVGTHDVAFMWHPWIHHYGENVRVPGTGRYTVRVQVAPPPFRRYGPNAATSMTAPIDLTFPGVRIVAGQK